MDDNYRIFFQLQAEPSWRCCVDWLTIESCAHRRSAIKTIAPCETTSRSDRNQALLTAGSFCGSSIYSEIVAEWSNQSGIYERINAESNNTMRDEYDFSDAMRGVTAARYAKGANVVVIDPEVLDVFPDGSAVNEALRALAPVIRKQVKQGKPRSA